MARTIRTHLLTALSAAAAALGFQPEAGAVLVGITPGGPHSALVVNADATPAAGFTDSWTIGSEQAPISMEYLASNGLWLNQLAGSHPYTIGQSIQLHEFLKIGDGGPAWVNWNQKFVTEGFNFNTGTLKVNGNLIASGIISLPDHNTIDFFFNALPAGTIIEITKNIQWMGTAGGNFQNVFQGAPNLIQLEQFPTIASGEGNPNPLIPEPATLSMLGVALSIMGASGKLRRRWKNAAQA